MIGANILRTLFGGGRPEDFDGGFRGGAKAEVRALVIGPHVAAGGGCYPSLAVDAPAGPVPIAIAALSPQSKGQPMIATATVEEQDWRAAESRDEDVDPAVVVDVAKGGAACSQRRGHAGIGALETAVVIQRKQRQLLVAPGSVNLLDIVQHVALCDEKVLPAVIIEIFQAHAPPGAARGQCAQAGLNALIAEDARTIVVIQAVNLARQDRNDDVGAAIVIIILKDTAHPRKTLDVGGECGAGFERAFLKSAVAVFMEEVLLHAVVGDKNVREAVAIVVCKRDAQRSPFLFGNS